MVKRYLDTHFGWIILHTVILLVVGYMIAGNTDWRTWLALTFAFIWGARFGFGEAVERFQARTVSKQ